MTKGWKLGLSTVTAMVLAGVGSVCAEDAGGDPLVVAATAGVPAAPATTRVVRDGERSAVPDAVVGASNAREVKVRPGVNKILPVAIEHINRIVTPFPAVDVETADPTDFKVSGGVIYLAPTSERPITYYLTASGDQTRAISLTLVPQHIPPVEINLAFEADVAAQGMVVGPGPGAATAAPASGIVQPYIDELRDLVRGLALGEVPAGYQMGPIAGRFPYCTSQPGFTLDFSKGQYFAGARFEAVVGVVRRDAGAAAKEFSEVACGQGPGIAAVAVWPSAVLSGGQESEIYVVKRLGDLPAVAERSRVARPSLIGGAP